MNKMIGLTLLGLALAGGVQAAAQARGSNGQSTIILSAPGPAQMLDSASRALAAGQVQEAQSQIEAAQHRLLRDSTARNLPPQADADGMRAAVPVLDRARQALGRQDLAAASAAVAEARAKF